MSSLGVVFSRTRRAQLEDVEELLLCEEERAADARQEGRDEADRLEAMQAELEDVQAEILDLGRWNIEDRAVTTEWLGGFADKHNLWNMPTWQ